VPELQEVEMSPEQTHDAEYPVIPATLTIYMDLDMRELREDGEYSIQDSVEFVALELEAILETLKRRRGLVYLTSGVTIVDYEFQREDER